MIKTRNDFPPGYAWSMEGKKLFFAPTRVWIGECAQEATHCLELPAPDDPRWVDGVPSELDVSFLTLSQFYPSGELGVCVEKKLGKPFWRHPNHPTFDGCVAWMPLDALRLEAKPV